MAESSSLAPAQKADEAAEELVSASKPADVGMNLERLERTLPFLQQLIDDGRLPFARVMVSRKGRLVFDRSLDGLLPAGRQEGAMHRLFSMTKIFTSVTFAVLMEKFNVQLDHAVADFLGEAWRNQQVHVSGGEPGGALPVLEPAHRPITMRDCLTHTSGLVYGGLLAQMGIMSYTDGVMGAKGVGLAALASREELNNWIKNVGSLEKHCDILATVPLKFQPGTTFEYAIGHMVIGRVIEVVSGMTLKDFMQKEVLGPLGCSASWLPTQKADLLPLFMFKAALEDPPRQDFHSGILDIGAEGFATLHQHDGFRESGGPAVWADMQMVGTAEDAMRLCELLTQRGRTADGKQLLSTSMADLITSNCLPGETGLQWSFMPPHFPATSSSGVGAPLYAPFDDKGATGFGLGGLVHRAGAVAKLGSVAASPGAYHWGGAACTLLQADAAKQLSIVFMTQLVGAHEQIELSPCGTLFQRIYQAIEED